MHKRIHTTELDIPHSDIECWERYPKYRWVYDLSRLLDAQHIIWSPYETKALTTKIVNMYFESADILESGHIFIEPPHGDTILSEVYIMKGEIKLLRHIGKQEFVGNIELRINAFISLHFQKFTGVITIESIGSDFMSIRLRACSSSDQHDVNISRLIKKIYKKADTIISTNELHTSDMY